VSQGALLAICDGTEHIVTYLAACGFRMIEVDADCCLVDDESALLGRHELKLRAAAEVCLEEAAMLACKVQRARLLDGLVAFNVLLHFVVDGSVWAGDLDEGADAEQLLLLQPRYVRFSQLLEEPFESGGGWFMPKVSNLALQTLPAQLAALRRRAPFRGTRTRWRLLQTALARVAESAGAGGRADGAAALSVVRLAILLESTSLVMRTLRAAESLARSVREVLRAVTAMARTAARSAVLLGRESDRRRRALKAAFAAISTTLGSACSSALRTFRRLCYVGFALYCTYCVLARGALQKTVVDQPLPSEPQDAFVTNGPAFNPLAESTSTAQPAASWPAKPARRSPTEYNEATGEGGDLWIPRSPALVRRTLADSAGSEWHVLVSEDALADFESTQPAIRLALDRFDNGLEQVASAIGEIAVHPVFSPRTRWSDMTTSHRAALINLLPAGDALPSAEDYAWAIIHEAAHCLRPRSADDSENTRFDHDPTFVREMEKLVRNWDPTA